MKEIIVPQDVVLLNLATRKPLLVDGKPITRTFKDYAFDLWLNDPKAGNKPLDYVLWSKVVDKFAAISGAGYALRLEDAEYAKLLPILREPSGALHPLIGVQLGSFSQAVEDAKTVIDIKSAQPSEAAPPSAA